MLLAAFGTAACEGPKSGPSEVPAHVANGVAMQAAEAAAGPSAWFAADADFQSCHESDAPAERITAIRDIGLTAEIIEKQASDGTMMVEVGEPISGGLQTRFVSYYRSQAACEASIAADRSIPARYQ